MTNPHHLELFHYVAKHGGIVKACRHIPYGIQQPAVSAQLIALEKSLGTRLFERKPFALTPAGQRVRDFIRPFFDGLPEIATLAAGDSRPTLKITGVSEFLKMTLPGLFHRLKNEMSDVILKVYDRNQSGSLDLLDQGEADLAVTVPEVSTPPRVRSKEILRLPLVMILPIHEKNPRNLRALLTRLRKNPPPLVSLPAHERLTRIFQSQLTAQGIVWPVSVEAGSIDLVETYVAEGFGWGLSVRRPDAPSTPGTRSILLKDFPGLPIAAFWKDNLPPVATRFLALLEKEAKRVQSS
ncbi:LysR family transcriptional regulator [Kamptonema cortianum]|nr:LysR family transcriptional regulator [Kamptonema cortianum]MDL5050545.1 LysR family transcriptional regulator [Oscillatoria amoena NRMC-F 0135]